MIILDTNVLSALMWPELNSAAVTWLDMQDSTVVRMTTISVHEMAYGIELMPKGKKRTTRKRCGEG